MNLYDIRQELIDTMEYGVDVETGEMLEDYDLQAKLDELSMKLDDKIENIGCYIKNLKSDAEALKQEKLNLAQRQKVVENKVEGLTKYLSNFMKMNEIPKFETPKVKLSFRKSTTVDITDLSKVPQEYIKDRELKDSDVKKTDIKNYLKVHKDEKIDGVELVDNQNIQIK